MNENTMVQVTADKISKLTGFSPEAIAIIKNTVAKGTTDVELAFFLNVCQTVNLNPLNKEIWCYKDNKNNLLVFTGRDGFLKKAQESPRWNGMTSFEVCKNDFFEMEVTKGIVNHKPDFKDRGEIIGAYAIVKPKNADYATIEWADFKVYNKGWNIWKTDPASMIKKVAEAHALKKAFGITVIQAEEDFNIKDNVAVPFEHQVEDELTIAKRKILDALDKYTGKNKELIKSECQDASANGTFDLLFASIVANKLGIEI